MNPYLKKLVAISEAPERRILGLMSGTSLDGLDMALCRFRNHGAGVQWKMEQFTTFNYPQEFKDQILKVYSKEIISLRDLCLLNEWIGVQFGIIINRQLEIWELDSEYIDLIASHGQTVYHAPASLHGEKLFPNGTLQIGDGDHIAQKTQIITISDFRQKNIAAGGEGAPLAPYGDNLLFSSSKTSRILINIGGISNFTFLPQSSPENSEELLQSSDLGPGNTLMDGFVQMNFPGYNFDPDGAFSERGEVVPALMEKFLMDPFFQLPFPKSTGPERFNLGWLESIVKTLNQRPNPESILASLNQLAVESIFMGIRPYLNRSPEIFISGGGRHNQSLRRRLQAKISPLICQGSEALGISPDAKEAILFGVLANECLMGASVAKHQNLTHYPQVTMGKISFPN